MLFFVDFVLLFFVGDIFASMNLFSDSLISESGIYGDLVQFIHQQLEKPFPVPNNTVHLKLPVTESIENPLLALHFALMRPESRKPFV